LSCRAASGFSVGPLTGWFTSIALHALVLVALGSAGPRQPTNAPPPKPAELRPVVEMMLLPAEPDRSPPATPPTPDRPTALPKAAPAAPQPEPSLAVAPSPAAAVAAVAAASHPPATQAAPPAPSAEEWAFASRYTLRNSKAYRHTWGQQVRSMMGTAVEGPDQGMVRFRVEIAPDGSLSRLDTLWSTSALAERLAREAIGNMPQWPPTPTGRPLVFEKTISFSPFASDGPPLYRNDCQPEPTAHRNRFAWDGRSEPRMSEDPPAEVMDPQALEDCLKQLPKDSIEAESARDQRVMDRWGWSHRQPGQ
jgi:hypothetical protein